MKPVGRKALLKACKSAKRRYALAASFRKYYDVTGMDERACKALADKVVKCLNKNNVAGWQKHVVGCRFSSAVPELASVLEIAALENPKAEQLAEVSRILQSLKPATAFQLSLIVA